MGRKNEKEEDIIGKKEECIEKIVEKGYGERKLKKKRIGSKVGRGKIVMDEEERIGN